MSMAERRAALKAIRTRRTGVKRLVRKGVVTTNDVRSHFRGRMLPHLVAWLNAFDNKRGGESGAQEEV